MRESRLALSYASEDRILLDKTEDIPYPQLQNLDSILRYIIKLLIHSGPNYLFIHTVRTRKLRYRKTTLK